jgi:hypothetical protein
MIEAEKKRQEAFKRNDKLEELLHRLNEFLSCSEKTSLEYYANKKEDFPVIFLMGPHRSGTTLFTQWLANTGAVAYPSNLLSRFYAAPVIGAQIQLLLTDPQYNFRNEILDFSTDITFESENGKTRGALSPNEFWYFWRRYLPFKELDWLSDKELFQVVDQENLVAELTSLTRVFGKPFALKSMILNYNIPFLNAIFKNAFFIQIKRDPITNVASILEARERQLGNKSEWYSFKIPEYAQLKALDPITQSSGQLHYINHAVTNGMATVDESRKLVVQYENFCQNPEAIFNQLITKLGIPQIPYRGSKKFEISREVNLLNKNKIEKSLAYFSEKTNRGLS